MLLIEQHRKEDTTNLKKSGSDEEYGELQQLRQEVSDLLHEEERMQRQRMAKDGGCKTKNDAKQLRDAAMSTYSGACLDDSFDDDMEVPPADDDDDLLSSTRNDEEPEKRKKKLKREPKEDGNQAVLKYLETKNMAETEERQRRAEADERQFAEQRRQRDADERQRQLEFEVQQRQREADREDRRSQMRLDEARPGGKKT